MWFQLDNFCQWATLHHPVFHSAHGTVFTVLFTARNWVQYVNMVARSLTRILLVHVCSTSQIEAKLCSKNTASASKESLFFFQRAALLRTQATSWNLHLKTGAMLCCSQLTGECLHSAYFIGHCCMSWSFDFLTSTLQRTYDSFLRTHWSSHWKGTCRLNSTLKQSNGKGRNEGAISGQAELLLILCIAHLLGARHLLEKLVLKYVMLLSHHVLSQLSKNSMNAASVDDIFEGNRAKDTTSDCHFSRLSRYVFPSKMLRCHLDQIRTLVLFTSKCTFVLPRSTMNNRRAVTGKCLHVTGLMTIVNLLSGGTALFNKSPCG